MHRKYAKDGLACVSVSVDEVNDQDKTLGFLKKLGATFPNYLLDEETEFWQNKWHMNAPPAVFVFDRNGLRAGKFDGNDPNKEFSYDDVEKLVLGLLKDRK
jgi:hypothetical protein